jgi:plasmid stabilization system protein ParE
MKLPVVLRDEAQAEFDEAFDFYEQRRAGLGLAFVTKVQDVFERIAANPRMHAPVFADVRKAVVAKFPYCVYFRADQARVEVIAVFHASRDPSIWQGRA